MRNLFKDKKKYRTTYIIKIYKKSIKQMRFFFIIIIIFRHKYNSFFFF